MQRFSLVNLIIEKFEAAENSGEYVFGGDNFQSQTCSMVKADLHFRYFPETSKILKPI